MCLYTQTSYKTKRSAKTKKATTPEIATKDIKVYKVFRCDFHGKLTSPHQHKTYKPGSTYKIKEFGISAAGTFLNNKDWRVVIYQGIHAWRAKRKAIRSSCPHYKIYEAIIPKGAKYFKGHNDDIVCNKLILTKTEVKG